MKNTKWNSFWNRYKVHTTIIVISSCIMGCSLHELLEKKETILSAAYINAFPNADDETLMDDFESYLGINTKRKQAVLDSSYYIDESYHSSYTATYAKKFSCNALETKFDVIISDEKYFSLYAEEGLFEDLSLFLTSEQLEQYHDILFYCDLPYDETEQPVPVGINVTHTPKIICTESYPNTTAYYGIVSGSRYSQNALSYLTYLETP